MGAYFTKDDALGKILGIERYVPYSESVKELSLQVSSGTTGRGVSMALYKHFEASPYSEQYKAFRHGYVRSFLRLVTKNAQALRTTHIQLSLPGPRRVLCLDEEDLANPDLARFLEEFHPEYLFGGATRIEKTLRALEGQGKASALASLRFIRPTSETTLDRHIELFRRLCAGAEVMSDYGLAETENVGVNCPELNKKYPAHAFRVFHPFQSVCTVEILEPDGEGWGEIAVSTKVTDIEGFRTGDIGKLTTETCPCGADLTLFVAGRKNFDVVYCAGATFLLEEIERVFSLFRNEISEYAVEVREILEGGEIIGEIFFRVIPKNMNEPPEKDRLAQGISSALQVTKSRTLADLVRAGIFLPPHLEYRSTLPEKRLRKS